MTKITVFFFFDWVCDKCLKALFSLRKIFWLLAIKIGYISFKTS